MGTTTAWYAIRTPSQFGGRSRVASSTAVCVTRGAYPPRFCSSTTNHQPTIIVYHNQPAIKRPIQDICYISSQPKIDQGFFSIDPCSWKLRHACTALDSRNQYLWSSPTDGHQQRRQGRGAKKPFEHKALPQAAQAPQIISIVTTLP